MKFIFKTLVFSLAILAVGCKSEPKADKSGKTVAPVENLKKVTEVTANKIIFEDGSSEILPTDKSIMFMVRHAETSGTGDARLLSATGASNAEKLNRILAKSNLGGVMSTSRVRAALTAKPTSIAHDLGIFSYNEVNTGRIYDYVFQHEKGKTFLIVGHSNTVPAMVKELTGDDAPAVNIPEDVYDYFYVVTGTGKSNCTSAKYRY